MRLFIIICRGSTSTNIKRVLTEPYAVVADHVIMLYGIDANSKLGQHNKRDEPQ